MESKIAAAVHLELEPVALIWADEKPAGALEFAPGKWGCVMFHLAAAARGKTAAISRETFGCVGGGVGLGFGNQYKNFPGGEECFCRFLSSGNAGSEPGETSESADPRAVVGLVDLSARKNVRRQLGEDLMSFSVATEMFRRMERNVEGSFLERETWKKLGDPR